MGPRLFSRGNSLSHINSPVVGESFNGAATLQPRKSSWIRSRAPRLGWLQWGRDSSAAEMPAVTNVAIVIGLALMGPRLFSRGNAHTRTVPAMPAAELQWGRDSSAAEIMLNESASGCSWRLQWGRDSSAAEISHHWDAKTKPVELQWGRDSSAAEMPPAGPETSDGKRASMGPRLFSRGNCLGRQPTLVDIVRFNGAATLQPRKSVVVGR